jgi:putative ABC transport system permease protein
LGLIIFTAIVGTLFLSYFERIKEIGIMRAIGTPKGHIFRLFLFEATELAFFGGIAGLILSNILSRMVNNLHLVTPPPPGYSGGYLIVIYNEPKIMCLSILLMMLISFCAAIIPGIKGIKTNIVEALRYV